MSDEWCEPNHQPTPRSPRGPAEAVWHVTKDSRTISCELRNEERIGAGWDVIIRQDGELSFSRRCADEAGARFVANALKQDQVNAGWTDKGVKFSEDEQDLK
jgi:hypothetical protein